MDRDEVEVHKYAQKERGQYPAILTEKALSIKDLLYGHIYMDIYIYIYGYIIIWIYYLETKTLFKEVTNLPLEAKYE